MPGLGLAGGRGLAMGAVVAAVRQVPACTAAGVENARSQAISACAAYLQSSPLHAPYTHLQHPPVAAVAEVRVGQGVVVIWDWGLAMGAVVRVAASRFPACTAAGVENAYRQVIAACSTDLYAEDQQHSHKLTCTEETCTEQPCTASCAKHMHKYGAHRRLRWHG